MKIAGRCIMKTQLKTLFLSLLATVVSLTSASFAHAELFTGTIRSWNPNARLMIIDHLDPVTGMKQEIHFVVLPEATFGSNDLKNSKVVIHVTKNPKTGMLFFDLVNTHIEAAKRISASA